MGSLFFILADEFPFLNPRNSFLCTDEFRNLQAAVAL